jgi:glutamine amidotransferase
MCRFTIYKGKPKLIGEVVVDPENSLLHQSRDAAYHPGVIDSCNKRNILVNGDGFGLTWYGDDVSRGGCCFKFVTPAWSDTNLRNIGRHISSPLIFAHVRAAASGHDHNENTIVSIENCHPFTFKTFTFMHNGGIPSFHKVKRRIIDLLSDETYDNIKGSTDSEHIFALFLECLPREELRTPCSALGDMVQALNRTICIVESLCVQAGILEHCSLNLCVTDGTHIIGKNP